MNKRRIANVMQKHMLHSEHAALCYIEAERRERLKLKIQKGVIMKTVEEIEKEIGTLKPGTHTRRQDLLAAVLWIRNNDLYGIETACNDLLVKLDQALGELETAQKIPDNLGALVEKYTLKILEVDGAEVNQEEIALTLNDLVHEVKGAGNRDLVIEECAKAAENTPTVLCQNGDMFSQRCAKVIRALKGQPCVS